MSGGCVKCVLLKEELLKQNGMASAAQANMTPAQAAADIMHEQPPSDWWAELTALMLREKIVSAQELSRLSDAQVSAARKALLQLLLESAVQGRVSRPETYILFPWYTWFQHRRESEVEVDVDKVREFVESGVATRQEPPQHRQGWHWPEQWQQRWPQVRAWLFKMTTPEFLRDFLQRRDVPVAGDARKRELFAKFALLMNEDRVRSRADLAFLGIQDQLPQNSNVGPNKLFRDWLRRKSEAVSLRPYVHGDPSKDTELDRALEHGSVALLKLEPGKNADEIARLERFLTPRFLESWLSFRGLSEQQLAGLSAAQLYALYLDLVSCSEASEALSSAAQTDAQSFCRLERDMAARAEAGDLRPADDADVRFHAELLRFAALYYISVPISVSLSDPISTGLSDDELNALALKVGGKSLVGAGKLSRRSAYAVLNHTIETQVSDEEFAALALERGLQGGRQAVAVSNLRRVDYFGTCSQDSALDLSEAARHLDLVCPPGLQGRALADSLMRQYLKLAHDYGSDCLLEPEAAEAVLRDFALKHQ